MYSRCDNSAGGPGAKSTSKNINNNNPPKAEESDTQSPSKLNSYTSKLRPRPTHQTDHYRSPSPAKRQKLTSSNETTVKKSASETQVSKFKVRPTRASLLRKTAIKETAGKKKSSTFQDFILPKKVRSEASTLPEAVINPVKKGKKGSQSKVKEVATKLWYPFIAPAASSDSDSEVDDRFQRSCSTSAANQPTRKLASRPTKSSSKTNSKSNSVQTSSSSTDLSKTDSASSLSSTKSKVGVSKSASKLKISKKISIKQEATNSSTESSVSQESGTSVPGVKTRSNSAKYKFSRNTKSKSSSVKEDKKGKKSPPIVFSRRGSKNTSKTGSCASTSRRGRGKSSSVTEPPQEDPPTAEGAAMSNEEAPPPNNATNNPTAARDDSPEGDNTDGEFDDSDMSRLQALLEARGLPSHFFGSLGPRVQHILHRSINSGTSSKAQQLLQGMQASGDESRQLQSVIEMCQLLVMGNEDTLTGFPIKMVVPSLITLLKMEHNFDMMNHACRALTYMMEALPRSSAVVVDAVPVFLEKLQSIQCMDVAEQSLTALEMLSRRHGPSILRANGLSSCLLYLDFFSLPAQRNALSVAANCCFVMSSSDPQSDFDKYYGSSVSMLVQRLSHHDKKCVESVCLCFARLVDNYRNEASILVKIACNPLLENFQNLLLVTPPLIGTSTFVMVIRTMCLLCSSCPNLAAQLVRNNIVDTLRYLLCGTATESEQIELVPRSPQELYEITSLIGELMPRLPRDDPMFSVDRLLKQNNKQSGDNEPTWQWKADDGSWKPYSRYDNRLIEDAHRNNDHEANLLIHGRVYALDFTIMQQVNEDTGNTRAIRRQPERGHKEKAVKKESTSMTDARVSMVKEDSVIISQFVRSLFTLLYEVYGSSAGSPAVRHKCLRAVQRMVYYAEPELLRDVLRNLSVSSHIASMLSSSDLKVVVGALQMAMILMNKLPDVFEVYFRRQGVTHQVEQLLDANHKVVGINQSSPPSNIPGPSNQTTPVFEGAPSSTEPSPSDIVPGRLSDILRRKYQPRRGAGGKRLSSSSLSPAADDASSANKSSRSRSSLSSPTERVISPPLTKAKAFAATYDGNTDTPTGTKVKSSGSRSAASSFFYNLNPSRWGKTSTSSQGHSSLSSAQSINSLASQTSSSTPLSRENLILPNLKASLSSKEKSENKEKVKQWVREQAKSFLVEYFSNNNEGDCSVDGEVNNNSLLYQLTTIAKSLSLSDAGAAEKNLSLLCEITSTSDVSSFELQHSGIVASLLHYLTYEDKPSPDSKSQPKKQPVSTSPMVTRRRSRTEVPKTSQSLDADKKTAESPKIPRPKSVSDEHISPEISERAILREDAFEGEVGVKGEDVAAQKKQDVVERDERLRTFLNVFTCLPTSYFNSKIFNLSDLTEVDSLKNLVHKLNLCISQLEQFSVKSHKLPSAPGRGSQALSFFARHQLKCQLHRHPDCNKSKQWHGGPVRVDPLALVQAIEKYLIGRGYGSQGSNKDEEKNMMLMGEDDGSEDEIEVDDDEEDEEEEEDQPSSNNGSASSSSANKNGKHRLELYISGNKLPYSMTVYQAVKHFYEDSSRSPSLMTSSDEREDDDDISSIASTGVWNTTHVIHYKLVTESEQQGPSNGKKGSFKVSPKVSRKMDSLWNSGVIPELERPLDKLLSRELPSTFLTKDPCTEVLCLMRVLHGLNCYWHNLYSATSHTSNRPLINITDFINSKLATKCHRQLQDPLMIMTGELPSWLSQLAHSCPFILPFETRQLLFRIVSFDRDRAMQYLLDIGALPDLTATSSSNPSSSLSHDASSRLMPKIEKKKCVVKRENLLHQASKVIGDYGHMRALLEIQYDGEVGTGLGPTLEFYTLTSHELQRSELGLWRSDEKTNRVDSSHNIKPTSLKEKVKKMSSEVVEEEEAGSEDSFVHSPVGLYPLPIGKTTKVSKATKICSKFRFMGKFIAKAVMDGRMVDLPLSRICYKWMLGQEKTITWLDLEQVDPGMSLTFNKLKNVLHQRATLEHENEDGVSEKVSALTMDGCSLEDLGLDFLLPGFPNIELMKGGSRVQLSINNLDKYLNLIAYWTLCEGVHQQLEAMREGFQSVFSLQSIDFFFPDELDQLFCGARYQPWTERELADSCKTDHGYTHDSEAVKTLFRVISQYDVTEQRSFLQFVTGSPHLPVGGLVSLHPPLTIVRKTPEEGRSADAYLPSVMTCVNYLKLPDYSSEAVMQQRLQKASLEGQKSFLLS